MKPFPMLLRVLLPVVLATSAACGASGTSSETDRRDEAAPAPPVATTPAATTPAPPATTPPSSAPGTGRAKCGAAAYDWVVSSSLGDVLEQKNLAPHTPLELNYALVQARSSAFKTKRLAKHSTKSRIIRYQTQDRGKLVDATASVAWPDVNETRSFPVLLVLHGTAGFSDQCSPSGGIADDLVGSFQDGTAILLSLFASLGYVVVAPDYIGLKSMGAPTGFLHPYLVAEPTAIASLDSVRAVKKMLTGNVTTGDLVVMGGSQGGHAAAFVNRYQPHYAPELSIKGSVWDVPPTNVAGQAVPALTSDQNATKNVVAATTTLESWYQASPNGLAGAFAKPFDTQIPQAMASTCSPNESLKNASLEAVFTPQYRTAGQQPGFGNYQPWACYMLENSLQTSTIPKLDDVPSLFLLAADDQLVNNTVERAAFQTLCSQGHKLQFLECSGASHTKPLTYAFDQWLDFLQDRLDGKPMTDACVVKPAERCTSQP